MYKLWCFLIFCILTISTAFAEPSASPITPNGQKRTTSTESALDALKGAACFVADGQGRILVVTDIVSNRISLPGGYIENKETPQKAAVRETLEETGIKVVAGQILTQTPDSVIFACQAEQPIPVHQIYHSLGSVPAWKAKDFGREVKAVFMMAPDQKMLKNARYPENVLKFDNLLKQAPISQIQNYSNFSQFASSASIWNSKINQLLQDTVKSLPSGVNSATGFILALSSVFGSAYLFVLLIPIAIATGGVTRVSQLIFTGLFVTVIVNTAKLAFQVPRPFYIFPDLQLGEASGYAFPSEHAAIAFAVWGLVYYWFNKPGRPMLELWLLPSLFVAVSQVYLGAHYITDVIAGAVIGTFAVVVAKHVMDRQWIFNPLFWAIFGLIVTPIFYILKYPTFLYTVAFAFTFALLLKIDKVEDIERLTPFHWQSFVTILFGTLFIAGGAAGFSKVTSSSTDIAIGHCFAIVLLTIWIYFITPRLTSR